jgi:hypothetical protein
LISGLHWLQAVDQLFTFAIQQLPVRRVKPFVPLTILTAASLGGWRYYYKIKRLSKTASNQSVACDAQIFIANGRDHTQLTSLRMSERFVVLRILLTANSAS